MHDPSRPRRAGAPRSRRRLAVALLAVAGLVLGVAPTALADSPGSADRGPRLLADGLAGPLSIDVTGRGDVLVGQGFAGVVSVVDRRSGGVRDVVTEPGAQAVAAGPFGTVVYTVSGEAGQLVKVRLPWGATRVLADLGAYEAANNPDAGTTYGAQGISEECAAQWPVEQVGPPQYTGIVESNPYALAMTPWGVFVADAAANAILFVDWSGGVRTTAVLPPQAIQLPDDPTSIGLPACAGGLTYRFEPVPTDIELSWAGAFVSLLPGGPEDPSLGARGAVVELDLRTGASRTVASGLFAATDLAVSPWGQVYVTELFGGRVSQVTRGGGLRTVVELAEPVAVEWHAGRLYVAHDAFGSGKVTVLRP